MQGNWSFAIYLVIVSILPESPVSAFTIRRTTTLRPLDLTGEESALIEVKSDLLKLNSERDNVKNGRDKLTIRKSVNFLTPDKKLAFHSRKIVTTTTVSPVNKQDELAKPSYEMPTRDTDTTTGSEGTETSYTKKYHILNTMTDDRQQVKELASDFSNPSTKTGDYTHIKAAKDIGKVNRSEILSQNKTNDNIKIDKLNEFSTSVEPVGSTTFVTEEIKTIADEISTSDIPVDVVSTTIINDNEKEMTKNMKEEEDILETTQDILSSTHLDITSGTETSRATDIDHTATYPNEYTESMNGQPSRESTKNPLWKKYTVIERKRIISTNEPGIKSNEEDAEIASSTLENAISVTPEHLLEEQQTKTSQSKMTTYKVKDDVIDVSLNSQQTTRAVEPGIKQLSSTQLVDKDITTKNSVESMRAGYLDISPKQSTKNEEVVTTEHTDITVFNETELLGSIFEIETQEDGPEVKNSTMVESQSQLADDAIKEELLKEAVLNDHAENSKRLEEQQDLDKVKPLDSNDTDDSLSVKPIAHGKGALYTVSSNYRKMKKIEVQPSKPFVRDPDDNSWRNESLTSLGIVFKAKNASKPFTQVLKNKTEAELNNLIQTDRDNNNEVPDLRQRLEKIAEVRKSRKKKIDKYGDTIYTDYEEASGESPSTPKTDTVSIPIMEVEGELFFVPSTTSSPVTPAAQRTTTPGVYMYKEETVTTKKPKKNGFHEYYDTTDEYDADYLSLAKIDLKKFTTRLFKNDDRTTSSPLTMSPLLTPFTKQTKTAPPSERKPTVQYFPPRAPTPQKVNINDYDSDFQKKVNMYEQEKPPKEIFPVTKGTPPPATVVKEKPLEYKKQNTDGPRFPQYKTGNLDKNIYVTFPPHLVEHANKYPGSNDESYNRASYVIKHYRDLINEAVKDDYDKSGEFLPAFTEAPLMGVTMIKEKDPLKHMDEDYDYDANFRKDILSRFVDNFNQNSERFKVDFPILYNNTVVHMKAQENGKVVASSSAFMKRLYGESGARAGALHKSCDPHCDVRVELSPAYELHYYVPDQEEKEEADLKPATLPFNYRL